MGTRSPGSSRRSTALARWSGRRRRQLAPPGPGGRCAWCLRWLADNQRRRRARNLGTLFERRLVRQGTRGKPFSPVGTSSRISLGLAYFFSEVSMMMYKIKRARRCGQAPRAPTEPPPPPPSSILHTAPPPTNPNLALFFSSCVDASVAAECRRPIDREVGRRGWSPGATSRSGSEVSPGIKAWLHPPVLRAQNPLLPRSAAETAAFRRRRRGAGVGQMGTD